LGLTFSKSALVTGWLKHYAPLIELQSELRESLGQDEFEAAWGRGQQMDMMATAQQVLKDFESV
jgi:hypothetical protein